MTWNKYEEAFHVIRKPDDTEKPLKWWRGGNLPRLNSFTSCLEEVYHGLFLAARHDIGAMVTDVLPRLRRLCDAAIELVEVWKGQHDAACACEVCQAVAELHAAWRALDIDDIVMCTTETKEEQTTCDPV